MREVLTEFDELMNAVEKINLNEAVMPFVNGRLVNSDSYNKVQKILDCPEMISSHKWLYNLDLDQLEEDEVEKINKLYDLGCNRGFIEDDLTKFDDEDAGSDDTAVLQDVTSSAENTEDCEDSSTPCPSDKYTIIYSAVDSNGVIKTGEAFSNKASTDEAKADVISNLSRVGYKNITILAIEQVIAPTKTNEADNEFSENDMLNNRPHNNHIIEDDADDSEDDSEDDSADAEETDDSEEDDSDDSADAEETTDSEEDDADDSEDDSEEDDSEETADTDDSDDSDDSADVEETDDADDADAEDDSEETADSEEDDSEDDSDDSEETEETIDSEEDDSEELSQEKKTEYKNEYKKVFQNTLTKCKFEKSFDDLTIKEKVEFLTELGKVWTKNEPTDFMSDKEIDQLNKIVVKQDAE